MRGQEKQSKHLDASALIACVYSVTYQKAELSLNDELKREFINMARHDEIEFGKSVYKELKSEVEKNPNIEVIISSTALAEACKKILMEVDKALADIMWSALKEIYNTLKPRYVEINREVVEVASELARRDHLLGEEFSDCLIVAQALCDPFSTYLVTMDNDIISSKAIEEMSAERKSRGERLRNLKIWASEI